MANLFIQTAFLGDLFLSIPALKKLKSMNPDEELWLFCRSGFGQLFKDLKLINSYVEVNKADGSWKKAKLQLQTQSYNYTVSVHQSFRTAAIVASLSSKHKIGYYHWWNFWAYHQRALRNMAWPEALRQLHLLSLLDNNLKQQFEILSQQKYFMNSHTQLDLKNNTPLPAWASASILKELTQLNISLDRFALPEQYIAISPGSVWPTKRWSEQNFVELINKLPYPVVLLGSREEAELCARIAAHDKQSINLGGKTSLLETLEILSHAKLTISNDSGAQHMAAAVECPVVSIFGPTVLSFGYRPWIQKARVVELDLACRPCGKHGAKSCPLGTHECMQKLSPDSVYDSVKDFL
ncbi:MAG: glycosyltransferase family 9 protein [Bdellovibrionales bacterium]|nr:glycosyltransferase family 9 protein [Bdellovibrionales bacterium]